MSGNKGSLRDKMITLMYLVLMAMLALNVSKSVLEGFVNITSVLEDNNIMTENKTQFLLQELENRFKNNPVKYEKSFDIAKKIREKSKILFDELETHKKNLINSYASINPETGKPDGSSMDSEEAGGVYF